VKGYRFIDPSIDKLIIERRVHFEESPLHAPLEPHAETSVPPPAPNVRDGESTYSNHDLDLSSEFNSKFDENVDDEPQQMPEWTQTTL
jgi:hypothetical protein